MSDRIDDVIRSLEDDPVPAWWRSDVACLITEVRRRRASAPPGTPPDALREAAEAVVAGIDRLTFHRNEDGTTTVSGPTVDNFDGGWLPFVYALSDLCALSRDGTASPSEGADTKGGT